MTDIGATRGEKGDSGGGVRVAMICDDLMTGGWTSLVSLLSNLSGRVSPTVTCLFGKGENAKILEGRGMEVRCLGLDKLNLPWKLLRLAMALRRERVSIAHTHLHLSHLIGQTAALIAGVPARIIHVHTLEKRTGGMAGLMEKFLIRRASLVLAVSEAAAKSFREAWPEYRGAMLTAYNGIDLERFDAESRAGTVTRRDLGAPPGSRLVATVANLKWQKGHKHLLAAAEILRDEPFFFMIVGDGPERKPLERFVRDRGLSGSVLFTGARTDVPALLAVSDMFVLPSVLEGFGICLLEACAAGLPIIATTAGGIPEVVSDRETALLVPPASPESLARALRAMKDNPDMAAGLAASARKRAGDFDIKKMAGEYEEVCLGLAGKTGAGAG